MSAREPIRLLRDPSLDGPTNMARDEALLTLVGAGRVRPAIRLYQWDRPTISLGYFQHYADYESLPPPAGGLPVVRRLTGGGAILHDLELTYSITLPIHHPLLDGGPNALYERAHDAIIAALAGLAPVARQCGTTDDSGAARGPFFCFARRHCFDVVLGADKLAGSAQRRTRSAVLQHGSIVLANRFEQQPTATLDRPFDESLRQVSEAFVRELEHRAGLVVEPSEWSDEELQSAASLVSKYAGPEWTRRT